MTIFLEGQASIDDDAVPVWIPDEPQTKRVRTPSDSELLAELEQHSGEYGGFTIDRKGPRR